MNPAQHQHYLNLNVRGLPVSATLGINEVSNRLIAEGKQICKLGLGQSPFPVPEAIVNALRDNAAQKDYLPVLGLHALREAVVSYYKRRQQLEFNVDNIIIGPGSKELMFILQLVYYGDLLIPSPSWVSYAPQAQIIGRHVHWLPTRAENKWLLTAEDLELFCASDPQRPRIIILNYPNNPTGCSYSVEQMQQLAEVARRYRIILLSDEIYGELRFDGQHQSIARYYPEGTIVTSGLSKWAGAGGWRLGTFAFPKQLSWLREAMAVVASETFTATSAPIQYAAVTAFDGSADLDPYLTSSRMILASLADWIWQRFAASGIQAVRPDGGFYMLPDFSNFKDKLAARGIESGVQLASTLLEETAVAFLPGSSFGRPDAELTARIAFVDFNGTEALKYVESKGISTLDEGDLRICCGRVLSGIESMCDWFESLT